MRRYGAQRFVNGCFCVLPAASSAVTTAQGGQPCLRLQHTNASLQWRRTVNRTDVHGGLLLHPPAPLATTHGTTIGTRPAAPIKSEALHCCLALEYGAVHTGCSHRCSTTCTSCAGEAGSAPPSELATLGSGVHQAYTYVAGAHPRSHTAGAVTRSVHCFCQQFGINLLPPAMITIWLLPCCPYPCVNSSWQRLFRCESCQVTG